MFTGNAQINYLSTLNLDEATLAQIKSAVEGMEVRQIPVTSPSEIDAHVWAQVDVLHTSTVFCDPDIAPRLRWVQLDTSGVDHLPAEALWNSHIDITTIGGISPVPLAEYVMWSILGAAHRLPELLQAHHEKVWPSPEQRWQRLLPTPVRGATVGVVGYGRIGREIARLAQAFGMKVLGLSRSAGSRSILPTHYYGASAEPAMPNGVELFGPGGLHELMRRSDYVVVVVPLTAETRNIIDDVALAQLKDGGVLINVARGGIVDENALRDRLRTGHLRAAVLDVFEAEPLTSDDPWWDEPNVFITPHVSGLSPEYSNHVVEIVRENLRRFVDGRTLINLVDRSRGY